MGKKKVVAKNPEAEEPDADHATTNGGEQTEQQPTSTHHDWQQAFIDQFQPGGAFFNITSISSISNLKPTDVAKELHRAQTAETTLNTELASIRQRLAAAVAETASKTRDEILLKKELHAVRAVSEPSVLQLRQLLLDPAVNREFSKVKMEMEGKTREAAAASDELQRAYMAIQDPSSVHTLTLQLHTLQEQYETLKRTTSDHKTSHLQQQLHLARQQLEEMKKNYGQLEDHAHALDDELEVMQREMLSLKRAVDFKGPPPPPITTTTTIKKPIDLPSTSHVGGSREMQYQNQQHYGGGGRGGGGGYIPRGGGRGGGGYIQQQHGGGMYNNMGQQGMQHQQQQGQQQYYGGGGGFGGVGYSGGRGMGGGGPPNMNKRPRQQ